MAADAARSLERPACSISPSFSDSPLGFNDLHPTEWPSFSLALHFCFDSHLLGKSACDKRNQLKSTGSESVPLPPDPQRHHHLLLLVYWAVPPHSGSSTIDLHTYHFLGVSTHVKIRHRVTRDNISTLSGLVFLRLVRMIICRRHAFSNF